MSAEAIAAVMNDIGNGRIRLPPQAQDNEQTADLLQTLRDVEVKLGVPVVVDCTEIYKSIVNSKEDVRYYEDNPCITPQWHSAAYCYENEHGNVICMTAVTIIDPDERHTWDDPNEEFEGWDTVKWVVYVFLFLGGKSDIVKSIGTMGPVHCWKLAIGEDGTPADLHWVHLIPEYEMSKWDMAFATLLRSMNFLNATNVQAVEPLRPRGERRRLERTGVKVHTINVFPVGRSTRSRKRAEPLGVPLTSVRGHYAHYGQCCPHHERKGLLFGKIEGRFWIPQHAIGAEEHGTNHHDYKLKEQA